MDHIVLAVIKIPVAKPSQAIPTCRAATFVVQLRVARAALIKHGPANMATARSQETQTL